MPIGERIFEKQFTHVICVLALLGILFLFSRFDEFFSGNFWDITTLTWLLLLVSNTIIHQVYVWFCWRTELHLGLLSKLFGKYSFLVYATLFFPLMILRLVLITLLAISNQHSISIPVSLTVILCTALTIPAVYLMYSVSRFFGFKRAAGIDHFDPSYKAMPFVREGLFRYTDNGMYIYGFLVLWIPGVLFSSVTALAAAIFSHLYIWVHYFCTEKPDIEIIYCKQEA
jgi:hypothetical protein